ncbi:MAG: DUF692 domain-containing protein [Sulfuricurvum sp.]|nr:DUF692 domain-containing protein [Sulfuricurvum sp.]MDP3023659.1 DUF692 domain-containing protein [Sulfuricurvum sp.]MDP3118994.1 DUF692 domain-containing protein [Sulfuricurvum sp.]
MKNIKGCGLGLRREFLAEFSALKKKPDWIEITPENWIFIPHRYAEHFDEIMGSMPVVAHGVSLSIGSPEKIDKSFLREIKTFLDRYNIQHYSEHLSFSTLGGMQTYELLPLPMTKAMVMHIGDKIKQVEDFLQRPLILENASYYLAPYSEMAEVDFLNEIVEYADITLLLDVNNVYVNATNHGFDADAYIKQISPSRVAYMHMAGHLEYPNEALLLDTHGEAISKKVWNLLERTLKKIDRPVMIERDNNIPPLKELMEEYKKLSKIVAKRGTK